MVTCNFAIPGTGPATAPVVVLSLSPIVNEMLIIELISTESTIGGFQFSIQLLSGTTWTYIYNNCCCCCSSVKRPTANRPKLEMNACMHIYFFSPSYDRCRHLSSVF